MLKLVHTRVSGGASGGEFSQWKRFRRWLRLKQRVQQLEKYWDKLGITGKSNGNGMVVLRDNLSKNIKISSKISIKTENSYG